MNYSIYSGDKMADDASTGTAGNDQLTALQQELTKATERAQRFEGQLVDVQKNLEKYKGIDLDKLKADSDALTQLMKEKAGTSGNQTDIDALIAKREKEIRDQLQPELETWQTKASTLEQQVKELTIIDRGFSQVSGMFNDDTHDFIKDIFRKSVAQDDTGAFIVKDKDGKMRYSPKAANVPMTLTELAQEIADKHPSFGKSTAVKGARQLGDSAGASADEVNRYLSMSPSERQQLPKEKRLVLSKLAIK
jgi:hypothetical protein